MTIDTELPDGSLWRQETDYHAMKCVRPSLDRNQLRPMGEDESWGHMYQLQVDGVPFRGSDGDTVNLYKDDAALVLALMEERDELREVLELFPGALVRHPMRGPSVCAVCQHEKHTSTCPVDLPLKATRALLDKKK